MTPVGVELLLARNRAGHLAGVIVEIDHDQSHGRVKRKTRVNKQRHRLCGRCLGLGLGSVPGRCGADSEPLVELSCVFKKIRRFLGGASLTKISLLVDGCLLLGFALDGRSLNVSGWLLRDLGDRLIDIYFCRVVEYHICLQMHVSA